MTRALLILAVIAAASGAFAQEMANAAGAKLRFLDKLTGATRDLDMRRGEATTLGRLTVTLNECRYPADNQTAEALANITVVDSAATDPVFNGWMVASSPALSALDHPRYDVWVLRCDVAELALPTIEDVPAEPEETAPADGQ